MRRAWPSSRFSTGDRPHHPAGRLRSKGWSGSTAWRLPCIAALSLLTGQAELAAAADGPVTPTHNSGPRLAAGPGKSTSPGQGPAPSTEPAAEPSATSYGQARETAARRQVEDSERVRAMQVDDQRVATEEAAQALVEERRLTVEQAEAFERLKRAETAVH